MEPKVEHRGRKRAWTFQRQQIIENSPSWSPDGKRIAFTSTRDGNYEIYLINADGTQLRRVTNHPERDDFAIWHPDGKRLLTIAERKGRFDLFLTEIRVP